MVATNEFLCYSVSQIDCYSPAHVAAAEGAWNVKLKVRVEKEVENEDLQ